MTGIVLAGGRSTRFGSDKLSAIYRGKPLLHHAIERVSEVCDEVVVVMAGGADAVVLPHVRVVHDELEGAGPLAGLASGLASTHTGLGLVAGGDMPELAPSVLREMLRVAHEAPVGAVALQDGERFRPLPVVVRTGEARLAAEGLLGSGERRLRAFLDAMRVAVIDEPTWTALDPERRTLFDVDEPGDVDA